MGSALCTQEWVANRMGVDKRTVRNWVKRGLLRQQIQNGIPMYDQDEVEQLAAERGSDFPVMNRKSFIELQRKIKKLEIDMSLVRRAIDIGNDPLRFSMPDFLMFYKNAEGTLGKGAWSIGEMEYWADQFDRLDEAALALISEVARVDNPWEVFFRLCINMTLRLVSYPDFKTDLKLQELHKRLDAGRRELRGTAIVWSELHANPVTRDLLKELDDPYEDLQRRLIRNSK